jgi:hypothetical protein
MEEKKVLSKKIPTLLGVFLLLLGLGAGLFLVGKSQFLSIKAGPTAVPKNVKVANISASGVTITWTTDTPVTGLVRYSENPAKLALPAGDIRDQRSGSSGSFTTHYVDLVSLSPGKTYYFEIVSGSQSYNDDNKPYQIATAPQASPQSEDMVFGKVLLPSGQGAGGVIVYLEIQGAQTMANLTKDDGTWRLPLSTARDKQGQYVKYDPATTAVSIFAQGGSVGTATAATNTKNDSPVADITLGRVQNLVETEAVASGAGLLTGEEGVATTSGSGFSGLMKSSSIQTTPSPTPDLSNPAEATLSVKVSNVSYNGEKIATSSPELRGVAPAGTVIKITVHSNELQTGTITVDESGKWSFTPPADLEPGEHTMTVEYKDEKGVLQKINRTFTVLAASDASGLPAFTATPSATVTPSSGSATPTATRSSMPATESGLPDVGTLTPTYVLSILGLGLFVLGWLLRNRLARIN